MIYIPWSGNNSLQIFTANILSQFLGITSTFNSSNVSSHPVWSALLALSIGTPGITPSIKSLNKLSILLSYSSLKKFRQKLDPRKYNGAIFLGLESPVVKSHGSTDALGFAYSIETCHKIIKANLIEKIKSHLIKVDDRLK